MVGRRGGETSVEAVGERGSEEELWERARPTLTLFGVRLGLGLGERFRVQSYEDWGLRLTLVEFINGDRALLSALLLLAPADPTTVADSAGSTPNEAAASLSITTTSPTLGTNGVPGMAVSPSQ